MLPVGFSVAVVLSGAWVAEAQAQTEPCPPGQPSDSCCTPGPSGNVADEEEGLDPDCPTGDDSPGGRSHRRGDDAVLEDNDTGSSDGSFRSRRGFGRGSGGGGPAAGSGDSEPPGEGEGPAETIGAGPESGAPVVGAPVVGAPGGGTTGGAPATSASAGSASKGGAGQGTAAQVGGSIARTGPDIGIPLGLAMTLLLVGTSLRRTNRPLSRTPRRGRRACSPEPAAPGWTYVDHSSSARAIEKF